MLEQFSYAAEKGKTQKDCINEWQLVCSIAEEPIYKKFVEYLNHYLFFKILFNHFIII